MDIAEKIKMLMKERGLRPAHLSKEAGIPNSTINSILKRGYKNLELNTLRSLAECFGVTMDYLAYDEIEDRQHGRVIAIAELTKEEREYILLFRQLHKDEQCKIIGRIEKIVEQEAERNTKRA